MKTLVQRNSFLALAALRRRSPRGSLCALTGFRFQSSSTSFRSGPVSAVAAAEEREVQPPSSAAAVDILGPSTVRISGELEITSKDLVAYVSRFQDNEQDGAEAVARCADVGAFAMSRADASVASSTLTSSLQETLERSLGSPEGPVVRSVTGLLNDVSRVTESRLRDVEKLLAEEIDPSRDGCVLAL